MCIHFHSLEASVSLFDKTHCEIFRSNQGVYQDEMLVPLLLRPIKNVIELKGIMNKARLIHGLIPSKDDALLSHLDNSLEKGLIRESKSFYGALVLFLAKNGLYFTL